MNIIKLLIILTCTLLTGFLLGSYVSYVQTQSLKEQQQIIQASSERIEKLSNELNAQAEVTARLVHESAKHLSLIEEIVANKSDKGKK